MSLDDELHELLAHRNARGEQTSANIDGIVGVLSRFRDQLRDAGFYHEDAFELVRDYFNAFLDRMPAGDDDD